MRLVGHLLKLGSRLTSIEVAVAYALPFALNLSDHLGDLFRWNMACQFTLFLFVVQIPVAITNRMSYVDIGWPIGLCVLATNCLLFGEGWIYRRLLIGGCLLLHGLRMTLGGLKKFYPYVFKEDLSRYQFARKKWVEIDHLPEKWWPLKMQQETLSQGFANSVVLAIPMIVSASNTTDSLSFVELLGFICWASSWIMENMADLQKRAFIKHCVNAGKTATEEEKAKLKLAVLGYAPFDGDEYWLWSKVCRHPNYLGEYICWASFCVFAIPSIFHLHAVVPHEANFLIAVALCGEVLLLRFFYDCLVFWTGAAPAEFMSVRKRPLYVKYQAKLPVLFPRWLPFASYSTEGWPYPEHTLIKKKST